jgi:hypothetical protein
LHGHPFNGSHSRASAAHPGHRPNRTNGRMTTDCVPHGFAACRRARCASSCGRASSRCRDASRQRSARSSGGSLPRGRARARRCVRSSNGAHTVHRWAKLPKPCWPPGPWRDEPLIWSGSRRPPTWLISRCTGPLASPALLLPCSSFIHPTNSRRACRQFREARRRPRLASRPPTAAGTMTASLRDQFSCVIAPPSAPPTAQPSRCSRRAWRRR